MSIRKRRGRRLPAFRLRLLAVRRLLAVGAAAMFLVLFAALVLPGDQATAITRGSSINCRGAGILWPKNTGHVSPQARRHRGQVVRHTVREGVALSRVVNHGAHGCTPGSKRRLADRSKRRHHRRRHHATHHRVAVVRPSQTSLPPPAGYTDQQMIFDDQFSGGTLDGTKWNTYIGSGGIIWNNYGNLPAPFSGPNIPGAGNEAAMFGPSQVTVDNGLTLTAQPNVNQYAGTYPWISGVVTTEGKFSLPTTGWYVQVKAKMPDQSRGMWPGIWFLPGVAGTPANELDGYEGGLLGADPNEIMHSDYFADQGQQQSAYSVGTEVNGGYNVYGFQFIPGQSITAYFNGNQVWRVSATSGITITGEPYEIILSLQVATQQTSGWHIVATATTPPATMSVAEVQAYS